MTTEGTTLVLKARPGNRTHLGATVVDGGVNFAVSSTVAEGVTVCLFDDQGHETQIELDDYDAGVWNGVVPDIGPGQAYGYRVQGPFDPGNGLRCNPHKVLLDPYARAVRGAVTFGKALYGHDADDPARPSQVDSAPYVPRSLVVDHSGYDWEGDTQLHRRSVDSVLYEVHVKGFTAAPPGHPAGDPRQLRGPRARGRDRVPARPRRDRGGAAAGARVRARGLPRRPWPDQLLGLQHASASSRRTRATRRRCGRPRPASSAGGQVNEFKDMVKALHRAGIEVILDVVYNHTAEGNENGPDAELPRPGQRHVLPARRRTTRASTTTPPAPGNSLNAGNPATLRLIMDSLRYWMSEMHVDGFRFDLAATLGREGDNRFDQYSAFFETIAQDPVIGQAKLIAEPWDVGQARQLRPRAVPRGVAGVERQVPRLDARLLAVARTSASPSSPPGSAGRPTCTAPRAAARPPR